jgi:hypothetical protein
LPGAKRSAMYGTPRLAIASSRSAWRCPLVLEKIEAELSNERLQAAEKQHLRRRAELIRSPLRLGPITWPVAMRSAVHQNRRSNGFFILRDARRWNGRKSRSTSHYAATLRQGKRVADGTTTAGVYVPLPQGVLIGGRSIKLAQVPRLTADAFCACLSARAAPMVSDRLGRGSIKKHARDPMALGK